MAKVQLFTIRHPLLLREINTYKYIGMSYVLKCTYLLSSINFILNDFNDLMLMLIGFKFKKKKN